MAKKQIRFGNLPEPEYNTKEAFNSLRTNLKFCGKDIKVVLITSSLPDEGKTETAIQLARAMGEDGQKVAIVDADLRKSVIVGSHRLEVDGEILGLTHYLSGQADVEDILYRTDIKGVDMILSGHTTPNPTALLGSNAFCELLDQLGEDYDTVLVDSPPLGAVIDAAVIAPHCDGAILVVETNRISHKFAQDMIKQLSLSGCRVLGIVLNKVVPDKHGYYNRYYKGYYSEYTDIGQFCSIADNCIIGGGNHPVSWVSTSPVFYSGKNILKTNFSLQNFDVSKRTIIGNDVWVGSNSIIKAASQSGMEQFLGWVLF
jgi:capsular exopolysaccharide synthesis family protein